MFRPTTPQRPMFGVEHRLDPEKRARLEQSWAHAFRTHALPLIDEQPFRRFFDEDNGRPNKSVRLVVSLLLLKELNDLTDRETLEQLEWNTAWHYALDVLPEDAHTCQKTLHNFRAMLLSDDQGAKLFEETTQRLIVAAKLKTSRQRLDSTHSAARGSASALPYPSLQRFGRALPSSTGLASRTPVWRTSVVGRPLSDRQCGLPPSSRRLGSQ